MAEIKWIKIATDIFNDEKIRVIQKMPEGDQILVIWLWLLTLAGKKNDSGMVYFTDEIPYTPEMLADIMNKDSRIISLALNTLITFHMIEIEEHGIRILNWSKHQNVEGMEKIKEQNRLRQAKYRHQKKLSKPKTAKKSNVTSRDCHAVDKTRKEEEKNINKKAGKEIIDYLNEHTTKHYKHTNSNLSLINARLEEGYTLPDLKKIIDNKVNDWLEDEEMNKYLRPSTLFCVSKADGYLNQSSKKKPNSPAMQML